MTSPYADFNGRPVDLTLDRAGLAELLTTVERRLADARTRQDKPAVEAFALQVAPVRKTLENLE